MGLFVWTYRSGVEFHSEPAGFRLLVGPAASGAGYRYRVFSRADVPADADMLASGSRESLREAIDAAEAAATSIDPSLASGVTLAPAYEVTESNPA